MRIPSLAIHLDRTANEKFTFNLETNVVPLLATTSANQFALTWILPPARLNSSGGGEAHHSILMDLIAKELDLPSGKRCSCTVPNSYFIL